jgi:hypothetical protein
MADFLHLLLSAAASAVLKHQLRAQGAVCRIGTDRKGPIIRTQSPSICSKYPSRNDCSGPPAERTESWPDCCSVQDTYTVPSLTHSALAPVRMYAVPLNSM